jgi:beta-lactamase superfamily II metal-dependent hydrolase
VDTGNAGDRDLGRIVETLKAAGVKQIDHMWSTHYHGDHVGSLLALAKQIPIMHFYDHGKPHPNDRVVSAAFLPSYDELSQGKRTIVKPGDKVKITGLDITAVASANQFIRSNLPGGGKQNAACTGVPKKDETAYMDPDNGESAGFVLSYGLFRTIDLGDLTWNGELDLMCPTNRIGTVDLYLTSHHGLEKSNSPALIHALQPRVAVMNNGTRKGGEPGPFVFFTNRRASRIFGSCTGRTTLDWRTRRRPSSQTWKTTQRSQACWRRNQRRRAEEVAVVRHIPPLT